MRTKIIREQLCNNCNGSGRVYDHAFGVLTLGFGYLLQAIDDDKERCPKCNGSGKIKLIEWREDL